VAKLYGIDVPESAGITPPQEAPSPREPVGAAPAPVAGA
jgi:hypothetical protein